MVRIQWLMACKIIIDTERCKGCGLCVEVCGKNCIVISTNSNKNGYFPAQPVPSGVEGVSNTECTGCANCAAVCSETIIEVYRDSETVAVESSQKKPRYGKKSLGPRKDKLSLSKEKV